MKATRTSIGSARILWSIVLGLVLLLGLLWALPTRPTVEARIVDPGIALARPARVEPSHDSNPAGPGAAYKQGLRIDVNYAHEWVEGQATPFETVTVTVVGKATTTGQAQGDGWFGTHEWSWDPEHPNIAPGDTIIAAGASMTTTVDPVGVISGTMDYDTDIVSGTIQAPWFVTVTVQCEVWEGGAPTIVITNVAGAGGGYFCDFASVGWDLQPGPHVAVRYFEPDTDTVINIIQPLNLLMNVNYGHDWVEGEYEAGHTLWITVTESDGTTIKATAELTTGVIPWWGDRTGFSTNLGDPWVPGRPDLQPGDWVFGLMDNGYASAARLGTIDGELDVGGDTISGTVYAGWFTETLRGNCGVWEPGGPGEDFWVEPDGGSYFCDFGAMGWDLLPGHDVGVQYMEPAGNWIINTFEEPAPDVGVEKWPDGSGQVMPGGPVVFTIRYRNDGSAAASTIVLTDTLPANTTYITDSSGVVPTMGPGWVAWTLGPLEPGYEEQFQIVLTNSASPSDTLFNQADIWTLYDFNYDNNHADAEAHVVDDHPDLYVNKHPNPGDPAPGQTYLYEINYGNNGPVSSGPVLLTDTLPLSTSVVSWHSWGGYNLWVDVSPGGDQLVLAAPTIPGQWGGSILLRLLVDPAVPVGTQLTNTVEITAARDIDPGNNWDLRDDVWVNNPRWDAGVDKNFGWGQLVPGGVVEYQVHFRNHGNTATQARVTETFPLDTSFIRAWRWTGWTNVPFPPDYLDDTVAVWDVGVVEPGEWYDLNVRLAISPSVVPGMALTNCAEIAINGDDEWPGNDVSCRVDTVRDFGPNLRVYKRYWWEWEGRLRYEVRFENVGTQDFQDAWITDTYPISTNVTNWWPDYDRWITATNYPGQRQIVFWVEEIERGRTGGINMEVDLDGAIIGQQGLAFTNTVEAPISGDVYPLDNYDQVVAYTGPDVYVEKWLSGGEPRPGAVVTFTVEFGNQNLWPWDGDDQYGSHITDTLPAEMTFITATDPSDPSQPWMPNILPGNVLEWGWGTMWSDSTWYFDLVVQITDTVEGGDVITNVIEAYGDSPDDVEYNYENNHFELPVTILGPAFQVSKVDAGDRVAGAVVTYTLTVNNIGNEVGTNVTLSDTLPAGLTYGGGDGTLVGNNVIWTFPSIAGGGMATGWFWGTLPCTGTVTNDAYRVVGSDQGVTSPYGLPISFTVAAPNMSPAFAQSATEAGIDEVIYFTDTSTTDGSSIVAWAWDFGDGGTGTGATTSHAYHNPGAYTVTLTLTDTCSYRDSVSLPNAVSIGQFRIYLPLVLKSY